MASSTVYSKDALFKYSDCVNQRLLGSDALSLARFAWLLRTLTSFRAQTQGSETSYAVYW